MKFLSHYKMRKLQRQLDQVRLEVGPVTGHTGFKAVLFHIKPRKLSLSCSIRIDGGYGPTNEQFPF